jgi:hypothetical protein
MIDFPWIGAVRPARRPLRGLLGTRAVSHIEPRAEERPGGSRGASRSTLANIRRISPVLVLLLIAVAVALAGCGKKGNPLPPPGEPDTYPRTYPHE